MDVCRDIAIRMHVSLCKKNVQRQTKRDLFYKTYTQNGAQHHELVEDTSRRWSELMRDIC